MAREIFKRLFAQEMDEDEESTCCEILNETLNIIVEPLEEEPSTVMILDDSAISRRILRKMLTDMGYTVVAEAADGLEAYPVISPLAPPIL